MEMYLKITYVKPKANQNKNKNNPKITQT